MSDPSRLRLWMTPDRGRFFLIPADVGLPAGSLELRSLQATVLKVDADAAALHEVDAARAREHVDAGWGQALGRVRDGWRDLLGRGEAQGAPPDLGAWLGVTPGELLTDPDKQREGRRTLIAKAGSLLGSDLDVERIDARIEEIGGRVVERGERLVSDTERLAERVEERGRDALRRLRALARPDREEP